MHNEIRAINCLAHDVVAANIAFDEFKVIFKRENILSFSGRKIVQNANFFATFDKIFHNIGADEPTATGNEKCGHDKSQI